jgi:hypothetical protein
MIVRRRNDRWWRGYKCVVRECLVQAMEASKHFSRKLEEHSGKQKAWTSK